MITVEVSNLKLYARHGIYPGEERTGGLFEVSLQVSYPLPASETMVLSDTVNYERLVWIIRHHMEERTGLLENLALAICSQIKEEFSGVKACRLSIYKLNAPIDHFTGRVGITLEKNFDGQED